MRTSITLILERKRPFQNTIYFQEDMTMLLNNMHPITYRILHLNSAVFPCHCIEQEELLCSNRLSLSVS